jgi:hypothetical protein
LPIETFVIALIAQWPHYAAYVIVHGDRDCVDQPPRPDRGVARVDRPLMELTLFRWSRVSGIRPLPL